MNIGKKWYSRIVLATYRKILTRNILYDKQSNTSIKKVTTGKNIMCIGVCVHSAVVIFNHLYFYFWFLFSIALRLCLTLFALMWSLIFTIAHFEYSQGKLKMPVFCSSSSENTHVFVEGEISLCLDFRWNMYLNMLIFYCVNGFHLSMNKSLFLVWKLYFNTFLIWVN